MENCKINFDSSQIGMVQRTFAVAQRKQDVDYFINKLRNLGYDEDTTNKLFEILIDNNGLIPENLPLSSNQSLDSMEATSDPVEPNTPSKPSFVVARPFHSFFEGGVESIPYKKAWNTFLRNLVSKLIYNTATGKGIANPNALDATTAMPIIAVQIFDYIEELIDTMSKVLKVDLNNIYPKSDTRIISKRVGYILHEFTDRLIKDNIFSDTSIKSSDSTYEEAYTAYAILSSLDELLEKSKLVSIKPEYKGTNQITSDKYSYTGIQSSYIERYGEEDANISDYTSPIVEAILSTLYIDEENRRGAIRLTGFTNTIGRMMDWAKIQTSDNIRKELDKGVGANWARLIDAYLESKDSSITTMTRQILQVIKDKIFNSSMDSELKDLFAVQALNTHHSAYRELLYEDGKWIPNSAESKIQDKTRFALSEKIGTSIKMHNSNKTLFKKLLDIKNITCESTNSRSYLYTITFQDSRKNPIGTITVDLNKLKVGSGYDANDAIIILDNNDSLTDGRSWAIIKDAFSVFTGIYIPDSVNSEDGGKSIIRTLALTIAISDADENKVNDLVKENSIRGNYKLADSVNTSIIASDINYLSKVFGTSIIRSIKDLNGNILPDGELNCWFTNVHQVIDQAITTPDHALKGNLFIPETHIDFKENKPHAVEGAYLGCAIRKDIKRGDVYKNTKTLLPVESMTWSIFYDFWASLKDERSSDAWFQCITFADKTRQFLDHIDLNKIILEPGISLHDAVIAWRNGKSIIKGNNNKNPKDIVIEAIIAKRKEVLLRSAAHIIYNALKAYGAETIAPESKIPVNYQNNLGELTSYLLSNPEEALLLCEKINNFFKGKKREDIAAAYKEAKATLHGSNEEQIDIVKTTDGDYILNPLLFHFIEVFSDKSKAREYFKSLEKKFAEDLDEMGFAMTARLIRTAMPENLSGSIKESLFVDSEKLHPLLEAYLYTHLLVGEQLQELHQGVSWAYRTKTSFDVNNPNYTVDISGRFIDETKRAMGDGATIKRIPPRKYGTSKIITIAAVEDLVAPVNGLTGEVGGGNNGEELVADGCVYVAPEQAIMENWSMPDGKVGKNFKKIIFNQIDPSGGLNQVKTAAFTITNALRKQNPHATEFNMELAYRRTHSKPIEISKHLDEYYTPGKSSIQDDGRPISHTKFIYYYDPEEGSYYKILSISYNGNNEAVRVIQKVDINGKALEGPKMGDPISIQTTYDLDQLYGGAWCMELDSDSGKLKYSDANNNIVATILCRENKKDAIIHYIAPISSIKVGMQNINSSDVFKLGADESKDLWTFDFNMGSVGIQLNAGHYVQGGRVTEPSQLMQAIGQEGVLTKVVEAIHKELANLTSNLRSRFTGIDLDQAIAEELLYSIANSGTTKSMTDVFLLRMQNRIEEKIKLKLPLSSPGINQKFESVIMTALNDAIKHTFPGLGTVQAPSWGFMQHFGDGRTYTELLDKLVPLKGLLSKKDVMQGIWDLNGLSKDFIDTCLSLSENASAGQIRIMEEISSKEINFEDTIIEKTIDGYKVVKIDGIKVYDKYRNLAPNGTKYIRWNTRGRDLLQQLVYFKVKGKENDKEFYTLYDFDSSRACFYLAELERLKKGDALPEDFEQKKVLILKLFPGSEEVLNDPFNHKNEIKSLLKLAKDTFKETCREYSDKNSSGESFTTQDLSTVGDTVILSKPIIKHAQVILGRMYAKKLGLDYGDNVREILDYSKYNPGEPEYGFFKKRLQGKYAKPSSLNGMVDAVLHSEKGNVYVVYGGNEAWNEVQKSSFIFKNINGSIYYRGERIEGAEGIEAGVFTADDGKIHNFIKVNNRKQLQALENSGEFDILEYNVREKNLERSKKFFSNYLLQALNTKESEKEQVNFLRKLEKEKVNRFINKLAKSRFEAFKTSLTMLGLRIPTQALQSVSAIDVIAFTDSDENEIYLPRTLTWIAGSDYDIDKFYVCGWSILDNGALPHKGDLYGISGEDIDTLPDPDGRSFDWVENKTATTKVIDVKRAINAYNNDKERVALIREILVDKSVDSIWFDGNLEDSDIEIFDSAAESLLNDLNRYNNTTNAKRVKRLIISIGMNNVVRNLIRGLGDVAVQSALLTPLNDALVKAASNKNEAAKADKNSMNPDLPTSIHKQQRNNMVAKSSVGIVANATKAFKVLSDDINNTLEKLSEEVKLSADPGSLREVTGKILAFIKSIIFNKKLPKNGKTELTTFAGLNFRHLIAALREKYPKDSFNDSGVGFLENEVRSNLIDDLELLQKRSATNDPDDGLSNLMTAATDNAKVLYLNPLNATGDFLTLYCYLICTGESLDDISDILTNPIFNIVRKYSEYNIFDAAVKEYDSLKIAIDFVKNEGDLKIVDSFHMNRLYDGRISFLIKNNPEFKEKLQNSGVQLELLSDNNYQVKAEFKDQARKIYKDFLELADEKEWKDLVALAEKEYPSSNTGATINEKYYILYYLKRRANDIKNIKLKSEKFTEDLDLVAELLPASEEFSMFSRILAINQGQKGTAFDQYKFISNFNLDINNKYKEAKILGGSENDVFSIERFFDPKEEEYIREQIAKYNQVKKDINILEYLNESAHFKEMYRTVVSTEKIIKSKSIISSLIRRLCNDYTWTSGIPNGFKIGRLEYGVITKYASDLLVYHFLTNLPSKFAWQYDKQLREDIATSYRFNDKKEGLKNFKIFMEQVLIPLLKAGEEGDYANNRFIQALTLYNGRYNGFKESNYTIDLDRGDYDTTAEDFEAIKADFLKIAKLPISDKYILKGTGEQYHWTYGDLFYLYHLMISSERYSSRGLGAIFSELAANESYTNPFARQFHQSIAELDSIWEETQDIEKIKDILPYETSKVRALISRAKRKSEDSLSNNTDIVFKFADTTERPTEEYLEPYKPDETFFKETQDRDIPIALLNIFRDVFGQGRIQAVSTEWINKNRRQLFSAFSQSEFDAIKSEATKGFVHNGIIYLKDDWRGDTLFHEISHVIAAHAKFADSTWYYKTVDMLWDSNDEKLVQLKKDLEEQYPNRMVSDKKEELFAKYIGEMFNAAVTQSINEDIYSKVEDAIRQIFRIDPSESIWGRLGITPVGDVLKYFKSGLYSYSGTGFDDTKIVLNQKLVSIKNALLHKTFKDDDGKEVEILREEC